MKKLFETLLTGIISLVFSCTIFSNTLIKNSLEGKNSGYIQPIEINENANKNTIQNQVDSKNTLFITSAGENSYSGLIFDNVTTENQFDSSLLNAKNEKIIQSSSILLEEETIASFNVFPNPASDKLFVRFNGWEGIKEIKLIDITGRSVLIFKSNEELNEIDISTYPKGIYLISVKNEFHYEVKKIKIQ